VERLSRLGVYGGTFDPPHLGHLVLAAEGLDQLKLDRILWVLTPNPPHKTGLEISPLPVRLALLETALTGNPYFEISRVDIDRPPPHYAVDTLRILHRKMPAACLVYLMGADSLVDLPAWHDPQQFVDETDEIGVMCRVGETIDLDALEKRLPGVREKVRFVDAPRLEIASSDIRRRIVEGRTYRYFLPEAVYRQIQAQHLYVLD
jgi:nicotinate-nucleotide adenylyltransferase